jgi:hypothetical protein
VFTSAVSYAVYLVYSGELVKRLGSLRLVGLATTVACLCCLLQFVLLRPLSAALVAPEVMWLSVLNATLCTAVPVLLVMMAIERIGAVAGGADRHGRADVHHPDGRADPGRAVHGVGRGGDGAGDCRHLRHRCARALTRRCPYHRPHSSAQRGLTWIWELQGKWALVCGASKGWALAVRRRWLREGACADGGAWR